MSRRLSAHERALWGRVAATVRPLAPTMAASALEPPAMPAPAPPRVLERALRVQALPKPAKPDQTRAVQTVAAATLDGSWDRKLRSGRLVPDRIIDLHDHSLDRANLTLNAAVEDAAIAGDRVLLVITGKGRPDRPGRIRAELHHWLDSAHIRHRIAALRPASPRHGGSGAFYLILRRQR